MGTWPHRATIEKSVPRLKLRGSVALGRGELMQNVEVTCVIDHPCDPTTIRDRQYTTSIFAANAGCAVQVVILSDDDCAQRGRAIFVVAIGVERAESVEHGKLTRLSDLKDRAVSVLTSELGRAVKHIVRAARECNSGNSSIAVVSVGVRGSEGVEQSVVSRLQFESINDSVAMVAAIGHPIKCSVRTQDWT